MQILPVQEGLLSFPHRIGEFAPLFLCLCCQTAWGVLSSPFTLQIYFNNQCHLRLNSCVKSQQTPWIDHSLVISLSFELSSHFASVPLHEAFDLVIYWTPHFSEVSPRLDCYLLKAGRILYTFQVLVLLWDSP